MSAAMLTLKCKLTDGTLEVYPQPEDTYMLSMHNPLAGDTEVGFGQTCVFLVTAEQIDELQRFILQTRAIEKGKA